MSERPTKHEYMTDRWRPQDEVPDEVWLKNFIEAYRRQEHDMEQLRAYARGLEEENVLLHGQMERRIAELEERLAKQHPDADAIEAENRELKQMLKSASVIPQCLRRTKPLRSLLRHLNNYTNELLALLAEHGITPPEPKLLPKTHPLYGLDFDELENQMLIDYFEIAKPQFAAEMKAKKALKDENEDNDAEVKT